MVNRIMKGQYVGHVTTHFYILNLWKYIWRKMIVIFWYISSVDSTRSATFFPPRFKLSTLVWNAVSNFTEIVKNIIIILPWQESKIILYMSLNFKFCLCFGSKTIHSIHKLEKDQTFGVRFCVLNYRNAISVPASCPSKFDCIDKEFLRNSTKSCCKEHEKNQFLKNVRCNPFFILLVPMFFKNTDLAHNIAFVNEKLFYMLLARTYYIEILSWNFFFTYMFSVAFCFVILLQTDKNINFFIWR